MKLKVKKFFKGCFFHFRMIAALSRHIKKCDAIEQGDDEEAKERWKRHADRLVAFAYSRK